MADRNRARTLGAIFTRLAELPPFLERDQLVRQFWDLAKGDFSPQDMGCNDVLVQLGLARRDPAYATEEAYLYGPIQEEESVRPELLNLSVRYANPETHRHEMLMISGFAGDGPRMRPLPDNLSLYLPNDKKIFTIARVATDAEKYALVRMVIGYLFRPDTPATHPSA